jgi:hypothetical protein
MKYISSSCCTLLGTRDTITLPSSSSWSDGHASCSGMYSDAVSGGPIWIQDGPLKCYNGATIDRTCTGGPISYVEVKNSGVAAQCTNEGSVAWSSTHLYTVDSTSTNIWAAYIDGSKPPVYPGKLTMGASAQVDESAEYAVGAARTASRPQPASRSEALSGSAGPGRPGSPSGGRTTTTPAVGSPAEASRTGGPMFTRRDRQSKGADMRSVSRRVVVVGVVGACLGIGALTSAEAGVFHKTSKESPQPVSYSSRLAAPAGNPNGATPQSVLHALAGRLNSADVVDAHLGGPPAGFSAVDPASGLPPRDVSGTLWLHATVRARAASEAETTKPIWEANLLTGDLRDALYADGLQPLVSSTVSVALPDGRVLDDVAGGIGNVRAGQVFSSASPAKVETTLRAAAKAAGLQIGSIEVFDVDQPAPAVVATTTHPLAVASDPDKITNALFGEPGSTYEAYYLQIKDRSGVTVLVEGADFRTGVGLRWANPGFSGTPLGPALHTQ